MSFQADQSWCTVVYVTFLNSEQQMVNIPLGGVLFAFLVIWINMSYATMTTCVEHEGSKAVCIERCTAAL